MGSSSPNRGEHKKYLKPTTQIWMKNPRHQGRPFLAGKSGHWGNKALSSKHWNRRYGEFRHRNPLRIVDANKPPARHCKGKKMTQQTHQSPQANNNNNNNHNHNNNNNNKNNHNHNHNHNQNNKMVPNQKNWLNNKQYVCKWNTTTSWSEVLFLFNDFFSSQLSQLVNLQTGVCTSYCRNTNKPVHIYLEPLMNLLWRIGPHKKEGQPFKIELSYSSRHIYIIQYKGLIHGLLITIGFPLASLYKAFSIKTTGGWLFIDISIDWLLGIRPMGAMFHVRDEAVLPRTVLGKQTQARLGRFDGFDGSREWR